MLTLTLSPNSLAQAACPKRIALSRGLFTEVDEADFEVLSAFKWSALKSVATFYAVRVVRHQFIYMHRAIVQPASNQRVDHRDGNGLNNRRANLRPCSQSQNLANRGLDKNNTSGAKGVQVVIEGGKPVYIAGINHGGRKYIGRYRNLRDAAAAYNQRALAAWGEFAWLNNLEKLPC